MYSKHRLEALSDAIFAIVMTLLVLDLKVPAEAASGHLWEAMRHDPAVWVSFALTFVIAARFWVLQHQVFDALDVVGANTLGSTFVFLGLVTLLPYSTSLLGHYSTQPTAFFFYFLNQFLIAASLVVKLELAASRTHLRQGTSIPRLRLGLYTMTLSMGTGVACALFLPLRWIGVPAAFLVFLGRRAKIFLPRVE